MLSCFFFFKKKNCKGVGPHGSRGPTPVLGVHGINKKSGSFGLKNRFSSRFPVFTVRPPDSVRFWKQCPSQLWQGEAPYFTTVIWCNLSLFYSIKFLPLGKTHACRNYGESIKNVRELSTMLWGVLKNFLNKEGKNKVSYTRYIFLKERGKKKQWPIFPSLRMKLLCKWIGLDPVHWTH